MIILGIDPGTAITGYGVVESIGMKFKTLDYGCIRTEADIPLEKRLEKVYTGLEILIKKWSPHHVAVEQLFFNKNVRTALTVGHARGVIILAAAHHKIPVSDYTPLQVKQAVVGYGRAEKQQVQQMVKTILNLRSLPKPDDAADALAIAICHAHSHRVDRNIFQRER